MTGAVISLVTALTLGVAVFFAWQDGSLDQALWWYSNTTAPSVRIEGAAGPLRGETAGTLTVQPPDRARVAAVYLDQRVYSESSGRVTVDTRALPDGQHQVEVVVRDTSRRENEARAMWRFTTDNTPPQLTVALDPDAGPAEGHTLLVRMSIDEPVQPPAADFDGLALPLQQAADREYWALVGIPPSAPNSHPVLRFRAADRVGNEAIREEVLSVAHTEFPEETLDLDPSLDPLGDQAARSAALAALLPVYKTVSGGPRWEGAFVRPVDGAITTEFATRRSYNGRITDSNHGGVDFAGALGAPVHASASGKVARLESSPIYGNVLILDHGAGVFSTYAHLQGFEVNVGDDVLGGQVVARVGSTGLSTGPHLHWEVWVNGGNVDPIEWTGRTFP